MHMYRHTQKYSLEKIFWIVRYTLNQTYWSWPLVNNFQLVSLWKVLKSPSKEYYFNQPADYLFSLWSERTIAISNNTSWCIELQFSSVLQYRHYITVLCFTIKLLWLFSFFSDLLWSIFFSFGLLPWRLVNITISIFSSTCKKFPAGERVMVGVKTCCTCWLSHLLAVWLQAGGSGGDRRCHDVENNIVHVLSSKDVSPCSTAALTKTSQQITLFFWKHVFNSFIHTLKSRSVSQLDLYRGPGSWQPDPQKCTESTMFSWRDH